MNRLLLTLAALAHLIPHPFGVSPIGATALHAGAFGSRRTAWLVPLVPLSLGLLWRGWYEPVIMLFVFAGFALSTLIGHVLLGPQRNRKRYAFAVAAAATTFFLVSNFSIWLAGMYPPTAAGLLSCYLNGLPYLGTAILADTFYSLVLFGLHAHIAREKLEFVAA